MSAWPNTRLLTEPLSLTFLSYQTATFATMTAGLEVLFVRLALNVVAILIEVIAVACGGTCRPDSRLLASTTALEVLADHDSDDRQNQAKQQQHRDHEIKF